MTGLQTLDLQGGSITDSPLVTLGLSGSTLTRVTGEMAGLTKMTTLHLRYNNIDNVNKAFLPISHLDLRTNK